MVSSKSIFGENRLLPTGVLLLCCFALCHGYDCSTYCQCTPSNYMRDNCVSGVCECVNGTVPDQYGCHKPQKPTVAVTYPRYWSGKIAGFGSLSLKCFPEQRNLASYQWFHDGKLIPNKHGSGIDVIVNNDIKYSYQCAMKTIGGSYVVSEPKEISGPLPDQDNDKPVIRMPRSAPVNATITACCHNLPAHYYIFLRWKNGEGNLANRGECIDLKMTPDMFNQTLTCSVMVVTRGPPYSFSLTSETVKMPEAPSTELPKVHVEGVRRYLWGEYIKLQCEFDEGFEYPTESLVIDWVTPQGHSTGRLPMSTAIPSDNGEYSCTVTLPDGRKTTSPAVTVIVERPPLYGGELVISPARPVAGRAVSITYRVPGVEDTSDYDLLWHIRMPGEKYFQEIVGYTDNVLRIEEFPANGTVGVYCDTHRVGLWSPSYFSA